MITILYGVMRKVAFEQRPKAVRTKLCMYIGQFFSTGTDLVPRGSFDSVWRHLVLNNLGGDVVCYCYLVDRVVDRV